MWAYQEVVGLDANTGEVLWQRRGPSWYVVGVSAARVVVMWLWDSFLQPMCESHRQDADLDRHPLALTRSACGPCQARVGVQVLDRATGEQLWEHSWQSAGHQIDWAIALDLGVAPLGGRVELGECPCG